MPVLLIGRVLGGMSTSLLFTAFESWMVTEHRKRGFDESWLASTFSISSWGNGFGAILAGFLAQRAAGITQHSVDLLVILNCMYSMLIVLSNIIDVGGDIGPFQLAIALTVACLVPIFFWRENYGNNEEEQPLEVCSLDGTCTRAEPTSGPMSMWASLKTSVKLIFEQPIILCLGLSQACFEGAVYTFGTYTTISPTF